MKKILKIFSIIIAITMVMSTCVYAAEETADTSVAAAAEAVPEEAEIAAAEEPSAEDAEASAGEEQLVIDETEPAETETSEAEDTDTADPAEPEETEETADDAEVEDPAEEEAAAEDPAEIREEEIQDPEAQDEEAGEEDAQEEDASDEAEEDPDEDPADAGEQEEEEDQADPDEETELTEEDAEGDTEDPEAEPQKKKTEETEEAKEASKAALKILSSNADFGKCTFAVTGVPNNASAVKIAVWCSSDKSDKKWYKAAAQSDGSYTATMYKYLHYDHTGTYQAKAYIYYPDGTKEYVGKKTFTTNDPQPLLKVERSGSKYKFTARYLPDASQVTEVRFAVWSDNNGQDDLQWYTGTFSKKNVSAYLTNTLSKHEDTGLFYVHAYAYTRSGGSFFISGSTFKVKAPDLLSTTGYKTAVNNKTGDFRVTALCTHATKTVKKVRVAVWSSSDKSDLKWYTAEDKGNGKYSILGNIKKHNYNVGTYTAKVRAYYTDGKSKYLYTTHFTLSVSKGKTGVSGNAAETKYKVTLKKLTIPAGAKKVKIAVWSEERGQDDLVWYTMSGENGGTYKATVNIKNHKTAGLYNAHFYYVSKNGSEYFIKGSTFRVQPKAALNVKVSGTKDADSWFKAVFSIKDSSSACKLTKVAVWCSEDMSDIVWYPVKANSRGNYALNIGTASHYGSRGTYHFQVYAKFSNGIETVVKSFNRVFEPESYIIVAKSNGTCKRKIKYVNPNVSSVQFRVWTEKGGPSDQKIYNAKVNSSGVFYATVNMDHFRCDGRYIIEVLLDSQVLDTGSFLMIDYLEQAIKFAYDDSIGYSQIHRDLNPDLDCSSLVYYSLKKTGYTVPGYAFATYSMLTDLQNAGFSVTGFTDVSDLQAGDILLRSGHTEIYAGNGLTVGAHDDEVGDIVGRLTGDQDGLEVCVAAIRDGWQYVFRQRTYSIA